MTMTAGVPLDMESVEKHPKAEGGGYATVRIFTGIVKGSLTWYLVCMRFPSLLTPWTVRFLRALCWYGFPSALTVYLAALVVEQFRPGVFSLTISLTTLLQIAVVLGVCALLLPRPEGIFIRRWGHGPMFVVSTVIACVSGLVVLQQIALYVVLRVAIAAIVAVTAFFVSHALLGDSETET